MKVGTDLMAADRRGNTPFHLALSRLRLIDKTSSNAPFPLHKKRQIENVGHLDSFICVSSFFISDC